PVLVRRRLHVVETYTNAAIDWGPKAGGGWEGQFLFASISGSPAGRVGAAVSGPNLWSAWTELTSETISVLLTLSAETQDTTTVVDHGIFVSLGVDTTGRITGSVDGATTGTVQVYRELGNTQRELVASTELGADGSFSAQDSAPTSPTLYRAVYVDPVSGIPYAALLRTPV